MHFTKENNMLAKTSIVLTRVSANDSINSLVIDNLKQYAPIVAAFGNIDDKISQATWYQKWNVFKNDDKINKYLDKIAEVKQKRKITLMQVKNIMIIEGNQIQNVKNLVQQWIEN